MAINRALQVLQDIPKRADLFEKTEGGIGFLQIKDPIPFESVINAGEKYTVRTRARIGFYMQLSLQL